MFVANSRLRTPKRTSNHEQLYTIKMPIKGFNGILLQNFLTVSWIIE